MNIEDINLGDPPTGAGGDTMRTAFGKTNQNFGAAKQALEDEVQTREQRLETQRDQLIALIESVNGPLPDMRADFKAGSFGFKNESGIFLPCGYSDLVALSAPSPKWVRNAQCELVEVPGGQPAWYHDPVTGEVLGQLIEPEEATNNIRYSSDFSNYGVANGSIADYIASPDGGMTFAHLIEGTSAGSSFMSITSAYYGGGVAGKKYTFSCFAKSDGSDRQLRLAHNGTVFPAAAVFNLAEGTTTHPDGKIEPQGNGVYRCSVTGVASGDFSSFLMVQIANPQQTGTDGLYVWGLQFEEGELSSYIPTSGNAITRAADVVTIENLISAAWFNEQSFTFLGECIIDYFDTDVGGFGVFGWTISATQYLRVQIGLTGGRTGEVVLAGRFGSDVLTVNSNLDQVAPRERFKWAFSIDQSSKKAVLSVNGESWEAQFATLPDIANEPIQILPGISGQAYPGIFQALTAERRAKTGAELQELTTL